ncbi:hypothetical protein C1645_438886 [Glomus cerebriforme]|uniref:Uncharacterized protein n=1 Tax=Glomus cerebriforme TaxID=658196 RepID=A0A397TM10_9GLOM|nr:hypothetical protein C1645_438886 [Glomus cerebriforme]
MGNIEYITNLETFNERPYDDYNSSYQYNNFTNHNINKNVTERNANENNLIPIHENFTSTSSSSSSSFSSSLLSSSPETNVNNIINNINMQHITTTSPNTINTIKKSFTTGSSRWNNNIDVDSDSEFTDLKNSSKTRKSLSILGSNKPQLKSIEMLFSLV